MKSKRHSGRGGRQLALGTKKSLTRHGSRRVSAKDKKLPQQPDKAAGCLLCVEAILEILEATGFKSSKPRETLCARTAAHWENLSREPGMNWMKVAKYKIAAYAATVLKSPPPKSPFLQPDAPGHLIGGQPGRYLAQYLKSTSVLPIMEGLERRLELVQSILQSKKGMPRPTKDLIDASVKKTVETVTSAPIETPYPYLVDWADLSEHDEVQRISRKMLEKEVERTVTEAFVGETFSVNNDLLQAFIPSFKANFSATQKALGTFGLLRKTGVLEQSDLSLRIKESQTKTAAAIGKFPFQVKQEQERWTGEEQRLNPHVVENQMPKYLVRPGIPAHEFRVEGASELRKTFVSTYFKVLKQARAELPMVKAVGLPEALKVRTISKGPSSIYFSLKPLQQFMWSRLKTIDQFSLIGKPVNRKTIAKVMGSVLADGEAWLSVDYEAATDNLKPYLSNVAWDTFCRVCNVPKALWLLGRSALTGHIFAGDKGEADRFQQSGQLMGSIISFPILCLVNAAICRKAYETSSGKTTALRKTPMLINGDDALIRVNSKGKIAWERLCTASGLKPSVGKVYYDKHFLNINSTFFMYEANEPRDPDANLFRPENVVHSGGVAAVQRTAAGIAWESHIDEAPTRDGGVKRFYNRFTEVHYYNLGVSKGLKRSGGKADSVDTEGSDIGSRHTYLKTITPPKWWSNVHKLFLKHNSVHLEKLKGLPWYVPTAFGGLGMSGEVSRQDNRIVRMMVNHPELLQPRKLQPAKEIRIHDAVNDLLKEQGVGQLPYRYVAPDDVQSEDSNPLAELYLWVVYMEPHLVDDSNSDTHLLWKTVHYNQQVWSKYSDREIQHLLPPPWKEFKEYRKVPAFSIRFEK